MFSNKRSRLGNVEHENALDEEVEVKENEESSEEELGYQQLPSLKSRMKKALKNRVLDISVTHLTSEVFRNEVIPFLESHSEITGLDASGEPVVGYEICQYLSNNANITHLKIRLSKITAEGAIMLAANKSILVLDICNNYIGDEGAIALASNKNLKTLLVFDNCLTKIGAEAFAKNTSLVSLSMGANIIGDDGVKAFIGNNTLKFLSVDTRAVSDYTLKMFILNDSLTELDLGLRGRDNPKLTDMLEEISTKRVERYKERLTTFLMGKHPRVGEGSPILHSFHKNSLYDAKLFKEIGDFLKPATILKVS